MTACLVLAGRPIASLRHSIRRIQLLPASVSLRSLPTVHRRKVTMTTQASAHVQHAAATCAPTAARGLDSLIEVAEGTQIIPVEVLPKGGLQAWLGTQPAATASWAAATNFKGKDGDVLLVPGPEGGISTVVLGIEDPADLWAYAALRSKLPPARYQLSPAAEPNAAALGWLLGGYSFDRYKSKKDSSSSSSADGSSSTKSSSSSSNDLAGAGATKAQLVWPEGADRAVVSALAEAIFLCRDLITTPAEDLAPQHIAAEAAAVAALHGAAVSVIAGDDLLAQGYPAVHTVGRASSNPPHLVDIRWSPAGASSPDSLPRVTLVGKGVSFDTGGLDIKPASAMKLMKKDMGGAALTLGLAHAIMKTQLPVNLRLLIPTVENSISGNAFRPLDVLQTRAGITVENGNTDAEGRLILCDALAEAATEKPDVLIDAATLTGAARVALGTELPALFCNSDEVAAQLLAAGEAARDPLWRLPLHKPYRKMLDSKVADIYSCSEGGYAGAITAALFLQEFIGDCPAWAHIDTMGYNLSSKPGRPEGGEAFALRALFHFLRQRYAADP